MSRDDGPATTTDETSARGEAARRRRIQVAFAWTGPIFVVTFFGGWGILGGMVPPPSPSLSPEQVMALYLVDAEVVRLGMVIGMAATFVPLLFSFVISAQMWRIERAFPVWSILQFASGIITTVVLIIPMLIYVAIAFRPERAPELTHALHDVAWVMIVLPWPPLLGQMLSFALVVLLDRRPAPLFPRGLGYYNLWTAMMLLPVTLLVFWQSGPFSWNGIFGFWFGAVAFGIWYLVMCHYVLRAIRTESDPRATS